MEALHHNDSTDFISSPELPFAQITLWETENFDWETIRCNELIRYRHVMYRACSYLLMNVEDWNGGPLPNSAKQTLDLLSDYKRTFDEFNRSHKKPLTDENIEQLFTQKYTLNALFDAVYPEYQMDVIYGPIPNNSLAEWEHVLDFEDKLLHDIGGRWMDIIGWSALIERIGHRPDIKQDFIDNLNQLLTLSSGEMPKVAMNFQFIRDQFGYMCKGEKEKGKGIIGTVVLEPLDDSMKNLECVWSKGHMDSLVWNEFQNLKRLVAEKKTKGKPINLNVSFTTDGRYLFIHMDDTGPGWPHQLKGKNRFKKGLSIRNKVKGEGIGMYGLQKELVEDFEGYFETSNPFGRRKGGRLTAALPLLDRSGWKIETP